MDTSFSLVDRSASLAAMADRPVDILIIGGGITGAGIARDAAMRGFRTALVERDDFGSGTSSRSSRLVHGGLRYLEHREFRLVFEASRERRILLDTAPHLVWPLAFLFPIFAGGRVPRWKLAAGLALYDALALFRNVGRHRWLSKRTLLRAEPGLRDRDLQGGARYYDAQCDDARLTLATVRDAYRHGALVANYAQAVDLISADGRVRGAHVTDRVDRTARSVYAHMVVNATGPWSDTMRDDGQRLLRPTKGVHVVVPRGRIGNTEAITLLSPIDGRVMFVIPWGETTYIGTTDTDIGYDERPDGIRASGDDVVYLLRSVNALLPDARLQPDDVIATWAGWRPLLRGADGTEPSAVSREHSIVARDGLVSVMGGKLTTFRAMAAEVVDQVAAALHALDGRPVPRAAPTARTRLPGGEVRDLDLLVADAVREGVADRVARHLVHAYGSETPAVVRLAQADRRLGEPIVPGHPAIRAELIHALRREMAMTLGDLLIRRTHVFYEVPGQGVAQAAELVDLVADELGWDPSRKAAELAAYLQEVELNNLFRRELTSHDAD